MNTYPTYVFIGVTLLLTEVYLPDLIQLESQISFKQQVSTRRQTTHVA